MIALGHASAILPTTCSGSISYARGRDNSAVHRLTITDNWQAFRRTCTDNRRTLDDNSAITTGSARMLRSYANSCQICHFRDARLAQFPPLLAQFSQVPVGGLSSSSDHGRTPLWMAEFLRGRPPFSEELHGIIEATTVRPDQTARRCAHHHGSSAAYPSCHTSESAALRWTIACRSTGRTFH